MSRPHRPNPKPGNKGTHVPQETRDEGKARKRREARIRNLAHALRQVGRQQGDIRKVWEDRVAERRALLDADDQKEAETLAK